MLMSATRHVCLESVISCEGYCCDRLHVALLRRGYSVVMACCNPVLLLTPFVLSIRVHVASSDGLACPAHHHVCIGAQVNVSMMIGAVLSWGLAWPLLKNRAGDWYPTGLASHSFRGLFACEPTLSKTILLQHDSRGVRPQTTCRWYTHSMCTTWFAEHLVMRCSMKYRADGLFSSSRAVDRLPKPVLRPCVQTRCSSPSHYTWAMAATRLSAC